jgi:hypothetical protein
MIHHVVRQTITFTFRDLDPNGFRVCNDSLATWFVLFPIRRLVTLVTIGDFFAGAAARLGSLFATELASGTGIIRGGAST